MMIAHPTEALFLAGVLANLNFGGNSQIKV